jgi:uncharacterized DUF497 family protein
MNFRWNEWNIEHLATHGVDPEEAEEAIESATGRYPRRIGDEKWLVWGAGRGGRLLQAIFVMDSDGTAFVIHARDLTNREKKRHRGRNR